MAEAVEATAVTGEVGEAAVQEAGQAGAALEEGVRAAAGKNHHLQRLCQGPKGFVLRKQPLKELRRSPK
jgi:hypothetical protein